MFWTYCFQNSQSDALHIGHLKKKMSQELGLRTTKQLHPSANWYGGQCFVAENTWAMEKRSMGEIGWHILMATLKSIAGLSFNDGHMKTNYVNHLINGCWWISL